MYKFLLMSITLSALILMGCAFGSILNISSNDIDNEINIIPNSSFERSHNEIQNHPERWFVLSDQKELIRLDSEESRSGCSSVLIDNPQNRITLVSDAFELDPTCVYYSRCFVKSEELTAKPLKLYLFAFNENGERVNTFGKEVYSDLDWAKIDFTSGFFKSNAKVGRIAITIPDEQENSFWVDDAESYKMHRFAFSQE